MTVSTSQRGRSITRDMADDDDANPTGGHILTGRLRLNHRPEGEERGLYLDLGYCYRTGGGRVGLRHWAATITLPSSVRNSVGWMWCGRHNPECAISPRLC